MKAGIKRRLRGAGIDLGVALLAATRADRIAAGLTNRFGIILVLHHVRPADATALGPNRALEITPERLEVAIEAGHQQGYDFVSMDEVAARIRAGRTDRPFAAVTFDDGYRDNLVHAAPVLTRNGVPFTVYVNPGFADGTACMWWRVAEQAIHALPSVTIPMNGQWRTIGASDAGEKAEAAEIILPWLRGLPETERPLQAMALAAQAGIDQRELVRSQCLDWDGIAALAAVPGCTIGAHTVSHPALAGLGPEDAEREMRDSRQAIERHLGRPVRHLAYPHGDATACGPREFDIASRLGFATAVTTRKSMLTPQHVDQLTALPRLSVNPHWRNRRAAEVLMGGAVLAGTAAIARALGGAPR